MEGFFKIFRPIFENGIWKNPIQFRLFFWILGNAVFLEEGKMYGNVKVNRGQYLRSYRKLQEDLEYVENNQIKSYDLHTIKRNIDKLKISQRITTLETELGTLFTIVNYEKYQGNLSENALFKYKDSLEEGLLETELATVKHQQSNNNKNEKNDKIIICTEIFNFWNYQDVRKHKKLNDIIVRKILSSLKEYSIEEIKTAISNYSIIINNDEYYFTYKWTLAEFLSRGIEKFMDLEIAKNNYKKGYTFKSNNYNRNNSQPGESLLNRILI